MEATDLYTKNLFGLKTLDEEGRIFKITKEGDHLEYGPAYIQQVIVPALQKWEWSKFLSGRQINQIK